MKLIILAAGIGSRLRPVTLEKPKCLLPIGKTSIMGRIIKQFKKNKIKNILIVTGHLSEQIEKLYKKSCRIIYYPRYKTTNNFHTLWYIRKELNDDCIIVFSDLIVEDSIVKNILKSNYDITVAIDSSVIRNNTMFIKHKNSFLQSIAITKKKEATGNFIGILSLKKKHINLFLNHMSLLLKKSVNDYYVTILNSIIRDNIVVNILDVAKMYWREVDTISEYKKVLRDNKKLKW
jgi:choline kinase